MKTTMLKKVLVSSAASFALSALPLLAQTGDGIGVPPTFGGLGTNDLRVVIANLINVFLGFLGILAIIIFLWGGFRWMVSGGNEEKVGEAKRTLLSGIIGIIIILSSYAIVTFVITQLAIATGASEQ